MVGIRAIAHAIWKQSEHSIGLLLVFKNLAFVLVISRDSVWSQWISKDVGFRYHALYPVWYLRGMNWKLPPRIKIFEALGSIADERVQIMDHGPVIMAQVNSSDASKSYKVKFDPEKNKITSNDNASKWQGYTGYPIIAVLMKLGKLSYNPVLAEGLKGIEWKKINTQYKNDWSKTEEYIFEDKNKERFEMYAQKILDELQKLSLQR